MRSHTQSSHSMPEKCSKAGKPSPSDDESDDDNQDDRWEDINDDDEYSDSSDSADGPPSSVDPSKPMIHQLQEYYQTKVRVPEEEVSSMKAAVEQVAECVTEYIRSRGDQLLQADAFATGSAYEGTSVIHPNRCVK